MISTDHFDPSLVGLVVPPHTRRAGKYLLGPKLGVSPVKRIVQCLARLENSDQYFQVKLLTLYSGSGRHHRDETQDEKQGKMLLHTEHSLLSLLSGMEGVVQKHDFFTEMCLMEESNPGNGSKSIYNGRKLRRICLVLDCLTPNDFTNRTQNLVNLQHHVIKEKKLSEREALSIFYNVVCVVNKLHEKNVIHRDLKLGNIVLNCRSRKVTLTNFCLGKHLMKEGDLLKDQRGSPAYISPDVLSGKPYLGKPSDMWALGVVLFTMLYGQFPFYDSVPQELFNKIKTAEFTIPDDGRVSEDTKKVIKRLLVTDPTDRMTAAQTKTKIQSIIQMWRSISPGGACLQVVPEWKEEPAKGPDTQTRAELSHENVLLNLAHGRENTEDRKRNPKEWSRTGSSKGRIPVHRLHEDARPLTAEEYRMYSPVISQMRAGGRAVRNNRSSATSIPQVLVRSTSGILLQRQDSFPPAVLAPATLGPSSLPAIVPDQAEVLDLSSGSRRRETAPSLPSSLPSSRSLPPYLAQGLTAPVAHSRPREEVAGSALSLVGALRRLGTRVNLVPVNFSNDQRQSSRSRSPVTGREARDSRGARPRDSGRTQGALAGHRERSGSHGRRSNSERTRHRVADHRSDSTERAREVRRESRSQGRESRDRHATTSRNRTTEARQNRLQDANVVNPRLEDESMVTPRIGDASVVTRRLGDTSVVTPRIGDASVATPRLGDTTVVTPENLARVLVHRYEEMQETNRNQ